MDDGTFEKTVSSFIVSAENDRMCREDTEKLSSSLHDWRVKSEITKHINRFSRIFYLRDLWQNIISMAVGHYTVSNKSKKGRKKTLLFFLPFCIEYFRG